MLQSISQSEIQLDQTHRREVNNLITDQIYLDAIKREAVPVLGMLDREEFSPTYGCLDRTYWAWKFTDFPGARFQEGLCTLSFLYAIPFKGNDYYRQPKLHQWIAAGFDFWTKIQYPDGSFDEAYPFEHSLAATAFSVFYLSEAWSFLEGQLPPPTAARFKQTLERAGDWLIKNDEKHGFLSNHLAAAAVALYHIYRISGEIRFEQRTRYFIDKILAHQSTEGWYEEYGGADPGYQTHGSFYLARYLELSNDHWLVESLAQSLTFLAHFIHPDGSLGGEYASRNTQTYYPAAFEMMSATDGTASWIAATMERSVQNLAAAGLGSVDAYNYFPLLNNYVFAYLASQKKDHRAAPPIEPSQQAGLIRFPEAGLLKARTERYDLYVGLAKGGVLKVFDRQKQCLVANDCGYLGRLKRGGLLSSQWLEKDRKISVTSDEIVVEGNFYGVKKPVLRPFTFLGFRTFSLTAGRIAWVSYWLKSLLVKVLIYRKRSLGLQFRRRVMLRPAEIGVEDYLQGTIAGQIATLKWLDLFTTIHMGSSRYFIPNELTRSAFAEVKPDSELDLEQLEPGLTVKRTIVLS